MPCAGFDRCQLCHSCARGSGRHTSLFSSHESMSRNTHRLVLHDDRMVVLPEASLQPRCRLCVRLPQPAMPFKGLMTRCICSAWHYSVIQYWVYLSCGYPPCQCSEGARH
jgi:hypothetical protein